MSTKDRNKGPRAIDSLMSGAARRVFRKQGFVEASVITKWRQIVGDMLAEHCLPERMRFPRGKKNGATLVIRSEGAFALELQHLEPLILERINTFFGYLAVEKIQILHGALPPSKPSTATGKIKIILSDDDQKQLDKLTKSIEDQELRSAIRTLGHSVLGKKDPK